MEEGMEKKMVLKFHGIKYAGGTDNEYTCHWGMVKLGGITPPLDYREALRLLEDYPGSFTVEQEVLEESVSKLMEKAVADAGANAAIVVAAPQPALVPEPPSEPKTESTPAPLPMSKAPEIEVKKITKKPQSKPKVEKAPAKKKIAKLNKTGLSKLTEKELWKRYKRAYKKADPQPDWKLDKKATKKQLVKAIIELS